MEKQMLRKFRNLIVNIVALLIRDHDKRRAFRKKYKIKSEYRRLKDHILVIKNDINDLRRLQQQLRRLQQQQNARINPSNVSPRAALYISDTFKLKIVGDTKILDELVFNAPVYLFDTIVSNVTIDSCSCIYPNAMIASAKIGRYCTIGSHVITESTLYWQQNLSSSDMLNNAIYIGREGIKTSFTQMECPLITIGHDVKIGSHSIICPETNLNIGIGAIVKAGSVVDHDVEPYSIIHGASGQMIGKRFSDKVIDELLSSKWWEYDWPKILSNQNLACKFDITNVTEFLSVLSDCDKSSLPKIQDDFRHLTVCSGQIKIDDLTIKQ